MASPAPLTAELTCAAVQVAMLGETPRADDVCLLAIRLTGLLCRPPIARLRAAGKATSRLTKR